jgi:mevalonate kinase
MLEAHASGKIILCGEHAVVYARPAIALPLSDVRAYVTVQPAQPAASGITFHAPDLGQTWTLDDNPEHPLSELTRHTLAELGVERTPTLRLQITSSIPIASGLGSGAAIATAIVRALSAHMGRSLTNQAISALVYASERRFHGTPSGIDNTVVAFEQPIWFCRPSAAQLATTQDARPTIEPIQIAAPFTLLIGDTGIRSATHLPVGDVRKRWQADPAHYEALFDQVDALVTQARQALASGAIDTLGGLLNQNHTVLQQIGVSSPELDRLVEAARAAGALGAKLSGGGWGGIMIALVEPHTRERVAEALRAANAANVLETTVAPYSHAE